MIIAIVILISLALCLAYWGRSQHMDRVEKIGLELYEHTARSEGAFPFDYLSR